MITFLEGILEPGYVDLSSDFIHALDPKFVQRCCAFGLGDGENLDRTEFKWLGCVMDEPNGRSFSPP